MHRPLQALGAIADLSFFTQLAGSLLAGCYALVVGNVLYKTIDLVYGLRMTDKEQLAGSDMTYHRIQEHSDTDMFR